VGSKAQLPGPGGSEWGRSRMAAHGQLGGVHVGVLPEGGCCHAPTENNLLLTSDHSLAFVQLLPVFQTPSDGECFTISLGKLIVLHVNFGIMECSIFWVQALSYVVAGRGGQDTPMQGSHVGSFREQDPPSQVKAS